MLAREQEVDELAANRPKPESLNRRPPRFTHPWPSPPGHREVQSASKQANNIKKW